MRKALTGFAIVAFVAGVAVLAVSLSESPSALAQETEKEFFFQPLEDVLDDLVEDEVISEDQRDTILDALEDRMVRFGRDLHGIPHLEVVAEVLGIDVDALVEQLGDDSTIAEIAGDKAQEVIDALIAEHNARIDEAVAEERITEERAEELRAALAEKVEAMVNGEHRFDLGPFGRDRFHGPRGFDFFKAPRDFEFGPRGFQFFEGPRGFDRFGPGGGLGLHSIAEVLGLEADELMDRLADGEALLDIAQEQGVEVDEIVEAVLADLDEKLADLVADERLTQERADAIREQIADGIESLITSGFPPFGGFHFQFEFEGLPNFPDLQRGMPFPEGFDLPEDFDGFFHFHGPHDRFHEGEADDVNGAGTSA
jgi:hypothetical protein